MLNLPEIQHKALYPESEVLKELEIEFEGRGEVKGFHFKQLHKSDAGYLYKVNTSDLHYHYEVFQRKVNKQYNCVSYPRSASFSLWGWTYFDYEDALKKFNEV